MFWFKNGGLSCINFTVIYFVTVNELQDYLTPEFLEKLTLTDESKADIILAGKNKIVIKLTPWVTGWCFKTD